MQMLVSNLSKAFDQKIVLDNITMNFEKGKIYALVGRNGCGKTTFFNCIAKEISADLGSVTFDDGTLVEAKDVGYVYANPMLPEFLTGNEFLKFFLEVHKERGFVSSDVDAYFDSIQFDRLDRDKLIKNYSHGMRNKLQMLCVTILKPKVLLLDEPLTSFDLVASIEMKQQLRDLREGCITILSTHILQIAREICDELVVLHKGEMRQIDNLNLQDPNIEGELLEILKDQHES